MKVVDERSGTIMEEFERIVEFLRTEEAQQMILSELERLLIETRVSNATGLPRLWPDLPAI